MVLAVQMVMPKAWQQGKPFFVFYQSYSNHYSGDILSCTVNGWCSLRFIDKLWGHDLAISVSSNSRCANYGLTCHCIIACSRDYYREFSRQWRH
eukprot:11142977-Ditylum_brightwellii.AAC.1